MADNGRKFWIPKSRIYGIRLRNNAFEIYVKDIKIGILPNEPIATNIETNVSMLFFTFTTLVESALIIKNGMSWSLLTDWQLPITSIIK